jgi:hypothetical protein
MDAPQRGVQIRRKYLEFVFPTIAVAYSAYYVLDVVGERFETVFVASLLSGVIFVMTAGTLIRAWRNRHAEAETVTVPSKSFQLLFAMLLFIVGLYFAGFVLSFALVFPLMLVALGTRGTLRISVLTLALGVTIYAVFVLLIGADLPTGMLWR